jgi:very-short-patch-repair endonuclease
MDLPRSTLNPPVRGANHASPPAGRGVRIMKEAAMDERLERLCLRQHGVFIRQQALDAGVSRHWLDVMLRNGRLRRMHRCVYLLTSFEATAFTAAMAAVLAARGRRLEPHAGHAPVAGGPAVSHRMAAVLWQYLPADAALTVDVSGERLRRVPDVTLHRVQLQGDEVVLLRAVPVTSPARTLVDLAGVASRRELEQALAAAERAHGPLRAAVRALLDRRPRHRGSGRLRRLLAALEATGTPPLFLRSRAEEAALAMFRRARFPDPETNVRIAGHEVDFAWRALRLVVEVDGFEFHGSAGAFHRDHERDRDLAAAGCQVLRFTWPQLTRDADATLAALAATIARRQDALAASRGA